MAKNKILKNILESTNLITKINNKITLLESISDSYARSGYCYCPCLYYLKYYVVVTQIKYAYKNLIKKINYLMDIKLNNGTIISRNEHIEINTLNNKKLPKLADRLSQYRIVF